MIPLILIVVGALLGLLLFGFWGLILGGAGAFCLSMLIGTIAVLASGGLLPRKVRRSVAISFMTAHSDVVEAAFPNLARSDQLKAIEKTIEKIFRRASADNTSIDQTASLERSAIRSAADKLIQEESEPEAKELLSVSEYQIELEMYQ